MRDKFVSLLPESPIGVYHLLLYHCFVVTVPLNCSFQSFVEQQSLDFHPRHGSQLIQSRIFYPRIIPSLTLIDKELWESDSSFLWWAEESLWMLRIHAFASISSWQDCSRSALLMLKILQSWSSILRHFLYSDHKRFVPACLWRAGYLLHGILWHLNTRGK